MRDPREADKPLDAYACREVSESIIFLSCHELAQSTAGVDLSVARFTL